MINQAIEQERLDALYRHNLLDAPTDGDLYGIVARAADLMQTHCAGFSVVDRDRVWIKERVGIPVQQIERGDAFCDATVSLNRTQIVEDASAVSRYRSSPLVRGQPFIRFYAGVPVRARTGHALGALFVVGDAPRSVSKAEAGLLESLAREMELKLSLRQVTGEMLAIAEDRAILSEMLIHDVGNTAVYLKWAIDAASRGELAAGELAERCRKVSSRMQDMSGAVMRISEPGTHGIPVSRNRVELRGWLDLLAERLSRPVREARLEFHCLNELPYRRVRLDTLLLERIARNLVRNSIDACDEGCRVLLEARYREGGMLELHLADDGPGIPAAVRDHIFEPYFTWPPGSRSRAGLGLTASRLAAEALGGTVLLVPRSDSATEFVVEVPLGEN